MKWSVKRTHTHHKHIWKITHSNNSSRTKRKSDPANTKPCLSSLFITFLLNTIYLIRGWVFIVSHHVMLSNNLDYCFLLNFDGLFFFTPLFLFSLFATVNSIGVLWWSVCMWISILLAARIRYDALTITITITWKTTKMHLMCSVIMRNTYENTKLRREEVIWLKACSLCITRRFMYLCLVQPSKSPSCTRIYTYPDWLRIILTYL